MRISESDIFMSSARSYVERHELKEDLEVWVGERVDQAREAAEAVSVNIEVDIVTLSAEAKERLNAVDEPEGLIEGGVDQATLIRKLLIEALTGRQIKVARVEMEEPEFEIKDPKTVEAPRPGPGRDGWGLIYNKHERHSEEEKTSFHATGIVKTADGKEIKLDLRLDMQRSFAVEENVSLRAGDAKRIDPLVVNFGGTAAELTSAKFSFDLDSDGKTEDVSFVTSGSGFLALDVNNDGKVNDGAELFGPSTGNGFAELKAYDSDNNFWIDEADPIYGSLHVWTKDGEGGDALNTLKDKGVGAIYLGYADTRFDLNGPGNTNNGQITSTGVYLAESGWAGTIQQVDLTV